jgi:hypothetical protein
MSSMLSYRLKIGITPKRYQSGGTGTGRPC